MKLLNYKEEENTWKIAMLSLQTKLFMVFEWNFFGVFDGHGGSRASSFLKLNLFDNILEQMSQSTEEDWIKDSLVKSFKVSDKQFLQKTKKDNLEDGSTAIVVVKTATNLIIANAGDCRAVLYNGSAVALSIDHKAGINEFETKRIEKLGGSVENKYGTWRVQGVLAVTRAIGDRALKQWVTSEPEVFQSPRTSKDKFLIIASDGFWDVFTNEEATNAINSMSQKKGRGNVAEALTKMAFDRDSQDNITVVVVWLDSAQ